MENNNINDHKGLENQDHPVLGDEHVIKNDDDYSEETAAEITADDEILKADQREHENPDVKSMYGWVAVALSVISFFIIPILFAGAGIIVGFIARNRHASILGNTAIVIGVLSIIFRLFLLPLI